MPTKKMRIEVSNNGDKYTITFEGRITRDKALHLLDLVELLGGLPTINSELPYSTLKKLKLDKVRFIIEKNFPIGWFSSKEIQKTYEEKYNEPIQLSTISTYLSRLVDRGLLIKKKKSNQVRYKTINVFQESYLQKR